MPNISWPLAVVIVAILIAVVVTIALLSRKDFEMEGSSKDSSFKLRTVDNGQAGNRQ